MAVSAKVEPGYVVKFEPFANADRVHHMLLYGCSQPAYSGQFWKGGATCGGGTHILWAWARNAPALSLPDDVAFPVGHEGDPIQYLVLQIHYAKPFVGSVQDYSGNRAPANYLPSFILLGVTVFLSDQRPKYVATVYLFVSGEPIPPRTEAFITNVSCTYDGEVDLHPFAFRTVRIHEVMASLT